MHDYGGRLANGVAKAVGLLSLGAAAAALLVRAVQYLVYAGKAVAYPFGMDYGEGIVWFQTTMIPGPDMYGDITKYPFVVFEYPPVYYIATRLVAAFGTDFLQAGRIVSVLSTFTIVAMIFILVVFSSREVAGVRASALGGFIGGLTVLTFWPVIVWSPTMRVDMLSFALGFVGLAFVVRSLDHPSLLYAAMVAFVLAAFTRQSTVAAGLASCSVLLWVNPRRTIKAIAFGIALVVAALAGLSWMTHGGFLKHVVLYVMNNRFDLAVAIGKIREQLTAAPLYLSLVFAGLGVAWWIRNRAPETQYRRILAILTAYIAVTSATLVTAGKSGASYNYFVEWLCAWGIMIGIAVAFAASMLVRSTPIRAAPAVAVGLMIVLQVLMLQRTSTRLFDDEQRIAEFASLEQSVREATKPVMSDDMVLLMRAGKQGTLSSH